MCIRDRGSASRSPGPARAGKGSPRRAPSRGPSPGLGSKGTGWKGEANKGAKGQLAMKGRDGA
eukprot:2666790-Lingulodinium_polyedra.AAC.1